MADADKPTAPAEHTSHSEPVPRLPRSPGIKLTGPEIFRIAMFAALLFAVLVLRKPCSDGLGSFVESFDDVDAGIDAAPETVQPQRPRSVGGYVRLTGDMSEDEIRAKVESARQAYRDAGSGGKPQEDTPNGESSEPDADPEGAGASQKNGIKE